VSTGRHRIYLVGFMGCGKSAVGRSLAERLGWDFEDTDAIVETREGRTVERIFADSGEARFRELESGVLEDLAARSEVVVATGGGLFVRAPQRSLMRHSGVTVWLDASLESIRERLGAGEGRPLWSREDPIAMRALYEKRRAAYALADFRTNASAGDSGEIASEILQRLQGVLR